MQTCWERWSCFHLNSSPAFISFKQPFFLFHKSPFKIDTIDIDTIDIWINPPCLLGVRLKSSAFIWELSENRRQSLMTSQISSVLCNKASQISWCHLEVTVGYCAWNLFDCSCFPVMLKGRSISWVLHTCSFCSDSPVIIHGGKLQINVFSLVSFSQCSGLAFQKKDLVIINCLLIVNVCFY